MPCNHEQFGDASLCAQTDIQERDGGNVIHVTLRCELSIERERWFTEYLMKASGVAFVEYREGVDRLCGYAVWEQWWDQFRFWLGVSILSNEDDTEAA